LFRPISLRIEIEFSDSAQRRPIPSHVYKNRILASLPASEIQQLTPYFSPVSLPQGETLGAAGKRARSVYFIESGLASIVTTMQGGRSVEVAVVGREGFIGIPALLGTTGIPNRVFMQIAGTGFRLDAREFASRVEHIGALRHKAFRYFQAHLVQASQTAACNRLHGISHRLARWILLCHDRVGGNEFEITQQSLSDMLGAPRPTVSVAAATLKSAGCISYSRGSLAVLNRASTRGNEVEEPALNEEIA
jgi:CRP-like cAMP-binding protein